MIIKNINIKNLLKSISIVSQLVLIGCVNDYKKNDSSNNNSESKIGDDSSSGALDDKTTLSIEQIERELNLIKEKKKATKKALDEGKGLEGAKLEEVIKINEKKLNDVNNKLKENSEDEDLKVQKYMLYEEQFNHLVKWLIESAEKDTKYISKFITILPLFKFDPRICGYYFDLLNNKISKISSDNTKIDLLTNLFKVFIVPIKLKVQTYTKCNLKTEAEKLLAEEIKKIEAEEKSGTQVQNKLIDYYELSQIYKDDLKDNESAKKYARKQIENITKDANHLENFGELMKLASIYKLCIEDETQFIKYYNLALGLYTNSNKKELEQLCALIKDAYEFNYKEKSNILNLFINEDIKPSVKFKLTQAGLNSIDYNLELIMDVYSYIKKQKLQEEQEQILKKIYSIYSQNFNAVVLNHVSNETKNEDLKQKIHSQLSDFFLKNINDLENEEKNQKVDNTLKIIEAYSDLIEIYSEQENKNKISEIYSKCKKLYYEKLKTYKNNILDYQKTPEGKDEQKLIETMINEKSKINGLDCLLLEIAGNVFINDKATLISIYESNLLDCEEQLASYKSNNNFNPLQAWQIEEQKSLLINHKEEILKKLLILKSNKKT